MIEIKCPFCPENAILVSMWDMEDGYIVFEMNCARCGTTVYHKDHSEAKAVQFFERISYDNPELQERSRTDGN